MTNRFTQRAKEALERAKEQAKNIGHTYIGTEHLLLGIMCTEGVGSQILDQRGALFTEMYDQVVKISGKGVGTLVCSAISPRCKLVLEGASSYAKKNGSDFVGTEHLLYAICDQGDCAGARVLSAIGLSTQSLKNDIYSLCDAISSTRDSADADISSAPTLFAYGKSLSTSSALSSFDPLIGRDSELERLIQILCRRTKNNPCLIGEPGVGKTAIVEGLAQRIASGNVPSELSGKIIVSLDLSSVLAGTKYRGEFEERMRAILSEVRSNESIILFIDEIHTIIGAGGAEGAIDAANIVKPALSRGELRVIGATTLDEYRKSIERDSALERRFQPVIIEEPSEDGAIEILKGLCPYYEAHHRLKISNDAILACVRLSQRYITDRFLPDKAIDLLDEACARLRTLNSRVDDEEKELENELLECERELEDAILDRDLSRAIELKDNEASLALRLSQYRSQSSKKAPELIVSSEDICKIVSQKTKIPVSCSSEIDINELSSLKDELSRVVIGQDEAIETVVSAIKRGRLGISNPNRPCASFLFLGPTGVGKTHLSKQIASLVFKSKTAFIRLDMSEFSEKHSVSRLIGAPAGYVGYDDGSLLCTLVKRNPYSVILFDEIEKAHSDIFNLLLQILDEGELTDSSGKKISFKSCIIILTSNLGSRESLGTSQLGFSASEGEASSRKGLQQMLKEAFSPELLNRLDEIVLFKPISFEGAKRICSIMLSDFVSRLKGKGIDLTISDEVIDFVTRQGYDNAYGARPIERAIISLLKNPLCEELLEGKIKENDSICALFDGKSVYYKRMNI